MQLLLLQNVTGVGKKFQIVDVETGLAVNTLLPKRQALHATAGVRKRFAAAIAKAHSQTDS